MTWYALAILGVLAASSVTTAYYADRQRPVYGVGTAVVTILANAAIAWGVVALAT